jgi:hypothetical protein
MMRSSYHLFVRAKCFYLHDPRWLVVQYLYLSTIGIALWLDVQSDRRARPAGRKDRVALPERKTGREERARFHRRGHRAGIGERFRNPITSSTVNDLSKTN